MSDSALYARNLGKLLAGLKVRSGRSYESIGRKIHASKSTVHRYCTGASVPHEFGVLERIGKACDAAPDEMVRLHQLWLAATTEQPAEPQVPARPVAEVRVVHPRRFVKSLLAAGLVTGLVAVSTSSTPNQELTTPAPTVGQWISGPDWQLPPTPVPSTLFGVTINSGTGAMPSFRVGAVRLWDSGTRWSEIQPARSAFDWSVLDRQLTAAENAGLPLLFTLGATPR